MKMPPLLLFATLAFWGWQSNLPWAGVAAGVVLELPRVTSFRWELEEVDFNRIWSFCVLMVLALAGYIFTTNDQGGLTGMFQGLSALRKMSDSSSVAATSVLRWLPLIFLPFLVAQTYNVRSAVPLTAISLVFRLRRRRGESLLSGRYLDVSYPYFIVCIFSAGIHTNTATISYFWGQGALILWALWTMRTGRYGFKVWLGALVLVLLLGFFGQYGINGAERVVQNFDAQMFARFFRSNTSPTQSSTLIGQIGELKLSPSIVIWLEPGEVGQAPAYLREASYQNYSAKTMIWFAGSTNFDEVAHAPHEDTTWLLVPGKTNHAVATITAYLNGHDDQLGYPKGVLPLPSGSSRLEKLPVYSLKKNLTGAVLALGPGLLIFDAKYGPGATCDSPPDTSTNQMDLRIPADETNALARVVAEMGVASHSETEKRLAVAAFFSRQFTYSTWQGRDKRRTPDATPLTRFLLTSRSGHCEYFATATVLLLRQLGIPARYAVGYYVHETSGSGYVIRERDAHAWCLAWNRQTKTWEDFDTTPGSWVAAEGRHSAAWDSLSDLRTWVVLQFEKLRWRQANLRQYILWTLVPVMLVLLYYILFQSRGRRRTVAKKSAGGAAVIWPGHDSAFYRLETALAARGLPRQPAEPLSEWLERVLAEPALADLRAPLRELLIFHYRYRFDPLGLTGEEKEAFTQNVELVFEKLPLQQSGK